VDPANIEKKVKNAVRINEGWTLKQAQLSGKLVRKYKVMKQDGGKKKRSTKGISLKM